MDSSNAPLVVDEHWSEPSPAATVVAHELEPSGPAAQLRGTTRGLEMAVDARATIDAIIAALAKSLDEAPSFFRGSDVRVRVDDGPLAAGCLARLDRLASDFGLRIVEVTAKQSAAERDAVPKPNLAAGSAPAPASMNGFEAEAAAHTAVTEPTELVAAASEPAAFEEPTQASAPPVLATPPAIELETAASDTRWVVGPVRSGVILDHRGHVVVFGDVNPGAEVRATGNIIVLGRLRGTAHAGIGEDVGFILALRLEPQQLRICRMVARAGESDAPASEAEIAYCAGDAIVVERYHGKLPRNLTANL
jgi:septum site-determining protein MinC